MICNIPFYAVPYIQELLHGIILPDAEDSCICTGENFCSLQKQLAFLDDLLYTDNRRGAIGNDWPAYDLVEMTAQFARLEAVIFVYSSLFPSYSRGQRR